jgi:hypothetical protein
MTGVGELVLEFLSEVWGGRIRGPGECRDNGDYLQCRFLLYLLDSY